MSVYYNENDPFKAAELRELIRANLIAPGEVDERSIEDVKAKDLEGFTQCHFFAGVGVWSYALRLAGWPDNRPVWTGSCPCQPFSAAGKQEGFNDERHLWPEWFRLIRECRPSVVFGEQVSAGLGPRDSTRSLRALWEQKAYLRLCENWVRRTDTEHLQDVSQRPGPLASPKQAGPAVVSGEKVSRGREVKIIGEGISVRPDAGMGSGEDGCGSLRSDGDSIQSCGETGLEHAVTRSDTSGRGLHEEQYETGPLRGERGLRELGREQDTGYCVSNSRKAQEEIGRLIECVDGEVEAETGNSWVNLVSSDLEASGYTFGAVVLGAHSAGAPHIRQRLYFVADSATGRHDRRRPGETGNGEASTERGCVQFQPERHGDALSGPEPLYPERRSIDEHGEDGRNGEDAGREKAHGITRTRSEVFERANSNGRDSSAEGLQRGRQYRLRAEDGCSDRTEGDGERSEVGNDAEPQRAIEPLDGGESECERLEGQRGDVRDWRGPGWLDPVTARSVAEAGATRGFWSDCDWWYGRDGKYRPIGAGLFPLVNGAPARVGRLRGYGDAIVAQVAQAFIEAYIEVRETV